MPIAYNESAINRTLLNPSISNYPNCHQNLLHTHCKSHFWQVKVVSSSTVHKFSDLLLLGLSSKSSKHYNCTAAAVANKTYRRVNGAREKVVTIQGISICPSCKYTHNCYFTLAKGKFNVAITCEVLHNLYTSGSSLQLHTRAFKSFYCTNRIDLVLLLFWAKWPCKVRLTNVEWSSQSSSTPGDM